MKIDVVINCFNYEHFIGSAIDSVLAQSFPANSINIVDDGSTDSSLLKIQAYAEHPSIRIISKRNAGQLSCFNAAHALCQGDVVAFLDADDTFNKDYLKELKHAFSTDKQLGCSFSSYIKINSTNDPIGDSIHPKIPRERALRALYLHQFYGVPTSGIALRKTALDLILPYSQEYFWRICADDILVMSASFLRIKSTTLDMVGFNYRVHEANNWAGKLFSKEEQSFKQEMHWVLADKVAPHLLKTKGYFLYRSILREMLSSLRDNSFKPKDFRKIVSRSHLTTSLLFRLRLFIIVASRGKPDGWYRKLISKALESRLLK